MNPARFRAPSDGKPDTAMLAAYGRDGFLLLEDFVPAGECEALRTRAAALAASAAPRDARSVFSAADQTHAEDVYFRESGDKIRYFYEPEGGTSALNKIGHALHDLDPVFDRFSRRPALAALATNLGFAAPLLLQSMYIFKGPRIGGEVGWHQDACFLYTTPISVIGFWFALEDATRDNGCMQAVAGGHRGPLRHRFLEDGGKLVMRPLDPTPWPETAPVLLEAPRGSLIVLHGLLPHGSAANRSSRSREAYTLHVIEGGADYPADNWLRRNNLPLRGFA
jgi:phytanoyl-CoA hydroxylase